MRERHDLPDVLEGPLFNLARFAQRQPQRTSGVSEIVRMPIGQTHPQFEDTALSFRKTVEHALERFGQRRDCVIDGIATSCVTTRRAAFGPIASRTSTALPAT